ncbi:15105_t:CDS:2 [Entrophospora sp. SA101]|nr:15105_t:CDS:2 [Entrophospora sp. SA101]
MFETNNNLLSELQQQAEIQDLLMNNSSYNNNKSSDNLENNNDDSNNKNNITFQSNPINDLNIDAQIQAMFGINNNDDDLNSFVNNSLYDNFQYPTDNSIFSSPEILNSLISSSDNNFTPNSFTTTSSSFDDNYGMSSNVLSPIFNTQDFTISPNDIKINDFDDFTMENSFDQLLGKKDDFDIFTNDNNNNNLKKSPQPAKNLVSIDKTLLKKKHKGPDSIAKNTKNMKKTNNELKSNLKKSFKEDSKGANNLSSPSSSFSEIIPVSMMDLDVLSQNILNLEQIPNNPLPTFDQSNWNQTDSNGTSQNAKVPISRLKNTSTQNQVNQPTTNANKQQKKVAHNVIERRYRNNINDRINELKSVVPALCHLKTKDDDEVEEIDGIPAARKLNKATILRKATEYIIYLKKANVKAKEDNDKLRKIIESLKGGIKLYNDYTEQQKTPGVNTPESSYPESPSSVTQEDFDTPPLTPDRNAGSRALMALFMCMTFFSPPGSYLQQDHDHMHHHNKGHVISSVQNEATETLSPKNILDDGKVTIDIWYLIRAFTFLICFTYIIRPSLFSNQTRQVHRKKSTIMSALTLKTKDIKAYYRSLSHLTQSLQMNYFELIIGFISEAFKLLLRKFLGWEISDASSLLDIDERTLEVELWARTGEVELCGGNKKVSRISILYTCFRTINLLENPYNNRKPFYISPSRIYANAAFQCYIGLNSIPFISQKAVSHFWKLANNKRRNNSSDQDKWLEIALACNEGDNLWKRIANEIRDQLFRNEDKLIGNTKSNNNNHSNSNGTAATISTVANNINNTTIPLTYLTDAQALFHLKNSFYDFISSKFGKKKEASRCKYSFIDLLKITTQQSISHWYALVGCAVEAFTQGNNVVGENIMSRLKDEYPKTVNNINKEIIAMGLFSFILLMNGKLEASINSSIEDDILKNVHDLAEFCVGWIVLDTKLLGWKIVEGIIIDEDKNKKIILPEVLDVDSRLKPSIGKWITHLRLLTNDNVFDEISKARDGFIAEIIAPQLSSVQASSADFSVTIGSVVQLLTKNRLWVLD